MGSTEEKQKEIELPPTQFKINPEDTIKLVNNEGTKEAYKMVRKTSETITQLTELAEETGCDFADLVVVWSKIPVENEEGSDSLAESGEAIIAISDAVDKKYPNMPAHEKTALKLKIMAKLLNSKAGLLESDN